MRERIRAFVMTDQSKTSSHQITQNTKSYWTKSQALKRYSGILISETLGKLLEMTFIVRVHGEQSRTRRMSPVSKLFYEP